MKKLPFVGAVKAIMYSARQKSTMKLGGLRGKITFTGDLLSFMPFLRLGTEVNVGQGTSFGLGRYEIKGQDL
jgi:hypothetical protein